MTIAPPPAISGRAFMPLNVTLMEDLCLLPEYCPAIGAGI
jgi:hypothetical protein